MTINLTLRSVKGSELSSSEVDNNFLELKAEFDELAHIDSTTKVGGANGLTLKYFSAIKSLPEFPGAVDCFKVASFHSGKNLGGGVFFFDPSMSKASHNGGTIIAPEAIVAWDGTYTNINTLLNWTGAGNGCYVRLRDGIQDSIEVFGGLRTPEVCTLSLQKLIDNTATVVLASKADYTTGQVNIVSPIHIDLNGSTVRAQTGSNAFLFRATNVDGITLRNGTMLNTKTLGIYVEAFRADSCQHILLEDLYLNGFTQFTLHITHEVAGTYDGFTIRRVRVHNAGNYAADASAISNCLEFFNRGADSIRTNTVIEDCEFKLMDNAKGNIAKFGVGKDTIIRRTKFYSKSATNAGSSSIQSGATSNNLNGQNRITFEDCEISCTDGVDGYYALDGVGTHVLIRTNIVGNGGSIYVAPKGTETQSWIFDSCNIVGAMLYDNPIHEVESIVIKNTKMNRLMLDKDNAYIANGPCIVRSLVIEDSKFDIFSIGRVQVDSIKITGPQTVMPSFGLTSDSFSIGSIEVSNRAVVNELIYAVVTGTVDSITFDNAIVGRISCRTNNLQRMLVKNCELRVQYNTEWYLNGLQQCIMTGNTVILAPGFSPSNVTNLFSFYSNAVVNNNTFYNITNRAYYITAANAEVYASNNTMFKANNVYNAVIGSGKVKGLNNTINSLLLPATFQSLVLDVSAAPQAHYQCAIAGGKIYMAIGNASPTDWKQISN
jgi:hypothetical protein